MSLSYTPWSYMPSEIIQLDDAFFGRKSPSNQITLSVKIIKQIKTNQFLVADATGYRKIDLYGTLRHRYKKKIREQNYVRIEHATVDVVKGKIFLSVRTEVFNVREFPVDETKPAKFARKPKKLTPPPPTLPYPEIATIPHQAWPEVSSFDAYKPLKDFVSSKKTKYGCLAFWIVLVVTIAIVTILWAYCYFGGSGCCLRAERVGDGKCDRILMNQTICNYDNGDCCQMEKAGNRVCDDFNNSPLCSEYDGGDCRPPNIEDWPACPHNPKFIGDGRCDYHLKNKAECNHDGADCCEEFLLANGNCDGFNNFATCKNYDKGDCRPSGKTEWLNCPFNPDYIGDGICFDHFKTKAECNYDSGDCCEKSLLANGNCEVFNNFPTCDNYDKGDCRPSSKTEWINCPFNPDYIGDGICFDHFKTKAECSYDSGDCCDPNLIGDRFCNDFNNFETCQVYDGDDCPPPDVTDWLECPHNPKFIGDGTCDDHLRYKAECNNDGSDCDSSGKYLIAGGKVDDTSNKLTEVVEYVETTSTPSFGQLPTQRYRAVGAMFGNAPILCGGYDGSGNSFDTYDLDTCISYQDSEWSQSHLMVQKRSFAAGVKINSTTFWILGGYVTDWSSSLDSTEFIIQGQTNGVPGPNLPYELYGMCAVKLSENEIFVIGGDDGPSYRNEVWIYDPQNEFASIQGPSLTTARRYHTCSTMRDGEKTVIIAAGGYNYGQFLDSVEIYDPSHNTWHSGPSLPYGLHSSAIAKSPDGRGVILFGGRSDENDYGKRILELCAGANSWTILDITLENGRYRHVVIPLQ